MSFSGSAPIEDQFELLPEDPHAFQAFPKLKRLSRECVVTEKLDGSNAHVYVRDCPLGFLEDNVVACVDGPLGPRALYAGSRNRYRQPEGTADKGSDNFGFATWVRDNAETLYQLGPGRHYGEWYGQGIQCGYGLKERRFALFNVHRWSEARPACCEVVTVLYRGPFDTGEIDRALYNVLSLQGSVHVPGFMSPEGIVVYHTASGTYFKKTLGRDGHKGEKV